MRLPASAADLERPGHVGVDVAHEGVVAGRQRGHLVVDLLRPGDDVALELARAGRVLDVDVVRDGFLVVEVDREGRIGRGGGARLLERDVQRGDLDGATGATGGRGRGRAPAGRGGGRAAARGGGRAARRRGGGCLGRRGVGPAGGGVGGAGGRGKGDGGEREGE